MLSFPSSSSLGESLARTTLGKRLIYCHIPSSYYGFLSILGVNLVFRLSALGTKTGSLAVCVGCGHQYQLVAGSVLRYQENPPLARTALMDTLLTISSLLDCTLQSCFNCHQHTRHIVWYRWHGPLIPCCNFVIRARFPSWHTLIFLFTHVALLLIYMPDLKPNIGIGLGDCTKCDRSNVGFPRTWSAACR